jgi:poly(A) polymerase
LQEVEDLNLVPEAYVPAIKLEFMGIEMDLLFAQLTQTNVSEDIELMNVELLRNLDDKSVRSVLPHPPV